MAQLRPNDGNYLQKYPCFPFEFEPHGPKTVMIMSCRSILLASIRGCALLTWSVLLLHPNLAEADASVAISGQDVFGKSVTVNAKGHYTLVLYTNPDLEDDSRKVTLALDDYRSRSNFALVRVVDLRGGVPPEMRSIVRVKIREEQAKENLRLKKAGVSADSSLAPIIADFSGATLNALGWDSVYDKVHVVIYDPSGHEIKRLADATDAKAVTKVVDSIL